MQGKVIVLTGATSGIGRAAAIRLAQMGARLVLVARDRARADETLAALRQAGPSQAHRAHIADLSELAEMKRVGAEIAAAEPRIDVLMNNAGSLFLFRQVTGDGLERTFATNHMAYFVLTNMLLDRLKAAAPARIVNTASSEHMRRRLDFDDLQMSRLYFGKTAYGHSKLCNVLFTRELARRLAGTGVTANCLHPGLIRTGLGQHDNFFQIFVRIYMLVGATPEKGADTMVYLASDPAVANVSGEYFVKCRPAKMNPEAQNEETARRLWAESARIAGIDAG